MSEAFPKGVFMLSLDTELAWGTRGNPAYKTQYEQTRSVIEKLITLLETYEIQATWAFVGHLFEERSPGDRDPLWFGPDLLERVRACKIKQEVGSHSFVHKRATEISREAFVLDLESCKRVAAQEGIDLHSYVYPENKVNYVRALAEAGFTSYRAPNATWYAAFPELIQKVCHAIDAYGVIAPPTGLPSRENGLVKIPGSQFYLHRHGWARPLPVFARVKKAMKGLARAESRKEIFHLWFHPFNLASDPEGLLKGLEAIFAAVAEARKRGKLEVLTMAQAAERVPAKPAAIILDGALQSSLATVRSLAAQGVETIVGAERKTAMSLHSRYAKQTFTYTSPMQDREAFMADVMKVVKAQEIPPYIFSFSDSTFLPLAKMDERIELAFDKAKTIKLATSLGVPVPKTWEADSSEIQFPCFLKPRKSVTWKDGKAVWGKPTKMSSREQLDATAKKIFEEAGEWPLIQEYVEGEERGVFAIYDHGKRVAEFAHKRLRSMDATGGASVLRESVALEPVLAEASWKLLDALQWHGPAMVEWKYQPETGKAYLMEINGRFWGSLPLAVASGIDFPWLWYKVQQGESVAPAAYKTGIKSRHLLADALALLRRVASGKGVWSAVKSFFRFREPNLYYDVESIDDPKPAAWELIDAIVKRF